MGDSSCSPGRFIKWTWSIWADFLSGCLHWGHFRSFTSSHVTSPRTLDKLLYVILRFPHLCINPVLAKFPGKYFSFSLTLYLILDCTDTCDLFSWTHSSPNFKITDTNLWLIFTSLFITNCFSLSTWLPHWILDLNFQKMGRHERHKKD